MMNQYQQYFETLPFQLALDMSFDRLMKQVDLQLLRTKCLWRWNESNWPPIYSINIGRKDRVVGLYDLILPHGGVVIPPHDFTLGIDFA